MVTVSADDYVGRDTGASKADVTLSWQLEIVYYFSVGAVTLEVVVRIVVRIVKSASRRRSLLRKRCNLFADPHRSISYDSEIIDRKIVMILPS